jgi:hypothetical protein
MITFGMGIVAIPAGAGVGDVWMARRWRWRSRMEDWIDSLAAAIAAGDWGHVEALALEMEARACAQGDRELGELMHDVAVVAAEAGASAEVGWALVMVVVEYEGDMGCRL